jgi:hypothetical protein
MDFGHRGWLAKVELVKAVVEGHAARVEHGAHGTIGKEGAKREAREEGGLHRKPGD